MTHNRKKELEACCDAISRNAAKITENFEHDRSYEIKIKMYANEVPEVEVVKRFFPRELIEAWEDDNAK